MDVSVSKIVAFQPGDHLAYSGITYTPGKIDSSLIFLLHEVFLSFLIRQRMGADSSDEFLSQFLHQSVKIP